VTGEDPGESGVAVADGVAEELGVAGENADAEDPGWAGESPLRASDRDVEACRWCAEVSLWRPDAVVGAALLLLSGARSERISSDPDVDAGRESASDPVLLLFPPEKSEEPLELLDALF
jgi:hypothetical protein